MDAKDSRAAGLVPAEINPAARFPFWGDFFRMPPPRQRVRGAHAVTEPASPPAWVTKRDGRLVPFEADKISRALFAASEELGRPDAFMARELTDSVVHFLSAEAEGRPLATTQIADMVVKVVRELGHAELAAAFAAARRQPLPGRYIP